MFVMQGVQISTNEDWNVVVHFNGNSDVVVADITAIVIHLQSSDDACELQTGRAPPLAAATEVQGFGKPFLTTLFRACHPLFTSTIRV